MSTPSLCEVVTARKALRFAAARVDAAGLNVSGITQAALTSALAERDTNRWLDSIARMKPTEITHAQALDALHAARHEMGTPADA